MTKIKKLIIITLLSLISAVCFTFIGCSQNEVKFVDFENKSIEFDLYEIFDATKYLEVYDTDGNKYNANIEIYDVSGQKVKQQNYQFKIEQNYYKLIIEIKVKQKVIGTREIIINGVNKIPPCINFLNMPEYGVKDTNVLVPLQFDTKDATITKKLVVERYVTYKVNDEYVTMLDTENAIVKFNEDFTREGVSFIPTKPGLYKISVYAWNDNQTEADASVVSKNYSIKEKADVWGEIESFETPASLEANYHYYAYEEEYNPYRGTGCLVYATNDVGDYLDLNGNILYKKVDKSATENIIAFYKKGSAQATEYNVLAYYQDLITYKFYDAEGNVATTKEDCVIVKGLDGESDSKFNGKLATIGEEWYQEYTDNIGVTKYGVIKANASLNSYCESTRQFYLKSTDKDDNFLKTYEDNLITGWVENPQIDYLSIWMLIKPKNKNNTQAFIKAYTSKEFLVTEIPVGKWFEYKVSKIELKTMTNPYNIFDVSNSCTNGSYITISNKDYDMFDFYFDNISYTNGADITLNSEVSVMGKEISLDIKNCGEFTKNDFVFYVGKTNGYDNSLNLIEEGVIVSGAYSITDFYKNHKLIENAKFIPENEDGVFMRKYFVQAMLNEQGLEKNNGEQIYVSQIIKVNKFSVSLSEGELGQLININASVAGVQNVTYDFYYKQTSATKWIMLFDNKFTPSEPTSYDVKVVATIGNATIEKTITKDYIKELTLSVLPAIGDNVYFINKDLTVVATLEGALNITISAVDENDNLITVTNDKLKVFATGTYTVTATANFNGVIIFKSVDIVVVGDKKITLKFLSNSQEIDINKPITLNKEITISVDVEGLDFIDTKKLAYKVLKIDSVKANNYEFEIIDGKFTAGFVGNYNVVVYYVEGQVTNASQTYILSVIANVEENAKYINTFSDSSSVVAAYKIESNNTQTYKNDYTTYAKDTIWHNEFKGRYGVISTKPQYDYQNSDYGEARLGIYLRSADYKTKKSMVKAGIVKTVYGQYIIPNLDDAKYIAFNSENWDYISIPVYFSKADAKKDQTITVSVTCLTQQFKVPYNTWYELKLDKPSIINSFSHGNGFLLDEYNESVIDATPTFCLGYDDVTSQSNINQVVYIDSMSFEHYKEYERFDELFFYDDSNKLKITNYALNTIEYTMNGFTMKPIDFIVNAIANGEVVDTRNMKTKYMTWDEGLITTCYNADGGLITKQCGYDISGNDGIYKITLSKVNKDSGYHMFCFTYEDVGTGKKYIGYRMFMFKYVENTT